jgi:predicted transcriptional regulator
MNTRILSKLAAAKWLNVSQPTLSNYLRDGRISRRALIGEGRHAKIDLARAVADLMKNLDEERLLLPHRRVYLSTEVPPWWDGLTK